MKYIVLTYANGGQSMLEAIGPETVIGMVTDVMRGSYNDTEPSRSEVTKIEIGNAIEQEKWKAA